MGLTVGIVGLGLIGASFAKAYKENEENSVVYGWNRTKSVTQMAQMQMGMALGQQMVNNMQPQQPQYGYQQPQYQQGYQQPQYQQPQYQQAPQQAAPQMQPQSADGEAPAIPKFCPYCGTATNGMKFCGNCGKQLA